MKKNKKIVLICGNFIYPAGNAPGKRVYGINKLLEDIGYNVIITGISKERKENNILDTQKKESSNIVYEFKAPKLLDRINVNLYLSEFRSVVEDIGREKIKYIIFYGSPVIALWLKKANSYAQSLGIKTIFDCVDWIEYSDTNNHIINIVKYIDTNYLKRCLTKQMDGLFTISQFLYDFYINRGVPVLRLPPIGISCHSTNIGKISNTVKFVYPCGKVINSQQKANNDRLKDRVDTTIKTMKILAEMGLDFHLDIFGINIEDYLFNYPNDEDILRSILKDKISFRGFVDNAIMITEWKNADFSISMREKTKVTMAAFPFKIAESMCLGTPVITNDTSNITEYVKDKVNGVIIPFDYVGAGKKIYEICSNRDLVYNLKKQCISNNPFDYNIYKEKIIKFLNKL